MPVDSPKTPEKALAKTPFLVVSKKNKLTHRTPEKLTKKVSDYCLYDRFEIWFIYCPEGMFMAKTGPVNGPECTMKNTKPLKISKKIKNYYSKISRIDEFYETLLKSPR